MDMKTKDDAARGGGMPRTIPAKWARVPGATPLLDIAPSGDGYVGLGLDNLVCSAPDLAGPWAARAGTRPVRAVDIMPDGSLVGVDMDHRLCVMNAIAEWTDIPNSGGMIGVTVMRDGTIVGVGTNNALFTRRLSDTAWTPVSGSGNVIDVAALADGVLLGVGVDNILYTRQSLTSDWFPVANGGRLIAVAALSDGRILGVGTDHKLSVRANLAGDWTPVGNGDHLIGIAAMPDGTIVGLGADNKLSSRATLAADWSPISDWATLIALTAAPDGSILGIGTDQKLYRRQALPSDWVAVAGAPALLDVSVRPDGGLLGVGTDFLLHTREPDGWKTWPNSGNQIGAVALADGSVATLGTEGDVFIGRTPSGPWQAPPVGSQKLRAISRTREGQLLGVGQDNVLRKPRDVADPNLWRPTMGQPLELMYVSEFDEVWNDAGGGSIFDTGVWRPRAPEGWHVLGYIATGPVGDVTDWSKLQNPNGQRSAIVARAKYGGILAPPVGYTRLGDDHGSGGSLDASWWRAIPPEGYKALGTVFNGSHDAPPLDAIMCVCDPLVAPGKSGQFRWADRYSGAYTDASMLDVLPRDTGISVGAVAVATRQVRGAPPKLNDSDGPLHVLKAGSMIEAMRTASWLTEEDFEGVPPPPRLTADEIRAVIASHGPHLHFHPEERHMPMDPNVFTSVCEAVTASEPYWKPRPTEPGQQAHGLARHGRLADAKAQVLSQTINEQFTDIQFWFFHGMNGETFIVARVWVKTFIKSGNLPDIALNYLNNGSHVGDWEHVTLRISNASKEVVAVCYSAHGDGRWYRPNYEPDGQHIRAYSALNMHGTYPRPGEYLELASWSMEGYNPPSGDDVVGVLKHLGSKFVPDLEARIFSRNMCMDEGQVMDASVAYSYLLGDGGDLPGVNPWFKSAADFGTMRWGPPGRNVDYLTLDLDPFGEVAFKLFEGDDNGPSTPSFAYE